MSVTPVFREGTSLYTRTLPREAASAAIARRATTSVLGSWGLADVAADGGLVMDELVANAAEHARHGWSVRITITRLTVRRARLAVIDMDPRHLPALRPSGPEDEDGRGLRLVAALTDRWGVDRLPWGKRVWAEVVKLP